MAQIAMIDMLGYVEGLAVTEDALQRYCARMLGINTAMRKVGMEVSTPKTKRMVIGRQVDETLARAVCGQTDREHEMVICGDDDGRYGCGVAVHSLCEMAGFLQLADSYVWNYDFFWDVASQRRSMI